MRARDIAQWRMHNLGHWGRSTAGPTGVVDKLGAMQAQEFAYAKWSIGQRANVNDLRVQELFDDGALLRTHVLRPTWHFVLPEDIRWMLALTAPRIKKMMASYDRRLELDEPLYSRTNRLIEKALQGGNQLTRSELVAILNRSKIDGTGQRFGHILLRAELEGIICSGATRGKQQTYALLDERASGAIVLQGDEALAELTRRYFTTRGPATLKDYSWWASLKMVDCKRAVELIGDALESLDIYDRTYWIERGSSPPRLTKGTIDLVQAYDECVVSYTLSRDVLAGSMEAIVPRDMLFWHPVLLDGQAMGHWRRRSKGSLLWLETFLFRKLTRNEDRALEAAVGSYEGFVGRPLEVRDSS